MNANQKNIFNDEDKFMEFFPTTTTMTTSHLESPCLILTTAPKDIESVLMFRPTFGCSPMGLQAGQVYSFWTIFSSGCIRIFIQVQ